MLAAALKDSPVAAARVTVLFATSAGSLCHVQASSRPVSLCLATGSWAMMAVPTVNRASPVIRYTSPVRNWLVLAVASIYERVHHVLHFHIFRSAMVRSPTGAPRLRKVEKSGLGLRYGMMESGQPGCTS